MSKMTKHLESLRDQPNDELTAALATKRDELFRMRLAQHTNQVTSTASLKTKRREIAQVLTLLNGRKAGTETQSVTNTASK